MVRMDDADDSVGQMRVKFNFRRQDGYELHFVNGAYGGLTPHGDIICEFYFECKDLPKEESGDLIDGNLIMDKENGAGKIELERLFKTGIIISPQEARNVAAWLNNKADEYEIKLARRENK